MVRPKKENRKEDILEAGLEVFAKRGYYNTTTALIAEKAGISQPYVFKFFKTKEIRSSEQGNGFDARKD